METNGLVNSIKNLLDNLNKIKYNGQPLKIKTGSEETIILKNNDNITIIYRNKDVESGAESRIEVKTDELSKYIINR